MPQLAQVPLLSVADYLAGEDGAAVRLECLDCAAPLEIVYEDVALG